MCFLQYMFSMLSRTVWPCTSPAGGLRSSLQPSIDEAPEAQRSRDSTQVLLRLPDRCAYARTEAAARPAAPRRCTHSAAAPNRFDMSFEFVYLTYDLYDRIVSSVNSFAMPVRSLTSLAEAFADGARTPSRIFKRACLEQPPCTCHFVACQTRVLDDSNQLGSCCARHRPASFVICSYVSVDLLCETLSTCSAPHRNRGVLPDTILININLNRYRWNCPGHHCYSCAFAVSDPTGFDGSVCCLGALLPFPEPLP